MPQWEHARTTINWRNGTSYDGDKVVDIGYFLTEWGKAGFELVSVTAAHGNNHVVETYFFKRPIE